MHAVDAQALALLNPWQRDFPLCSRPFDKIARAVGLPVGEVLAGFERLQRAGSLSRIGGVFHGQAGGAALLSALCVPPERLEAVAALVSAHPGVNHNYEREGRYNLWFVMTGCDAEAVETAMRSLEACTGLPALRLPMQRAYRIDLGFDLRRRTAEPATDPVDGRAGDLAVRSTAPRALPAALSEAEQPLAGLVEAGLPLVERPYAAWAETLGGEEAEIHRTLQRWLDAGQLRRFGVVVRHHELGFQSNAMTVFDVPGALVDACGEALAREAGITLAYRRARDADWGYNLYCMVHGRDRSAVREVLDRVIPRCGLEDFPRAVLFSCRRFKQTGARRFRALPTSALEGGSRVAAG